MMSTPWTETKNQAREQYEVIINNPDGDNTEALRGIAISLFGVSDALNREIRLADEDGRRKFQLQKLELMKAEEFKLLAKIEPDLGKLSIKTEPGTSASTWDLETKMPDVKVKVEVQDEAGEVPVKVEDIKVEKEEEEEEEKPSNKGKPRRSRRKRASKKY